MQRRLRSLAVLTGMLVWLPAELAAQDAQTGSVTGHVFEAGSQKPLADAQVRIVGSTRGVITNAQGEYRITGLAAGDVVVRAQRLGYTPLSATVTIAVGVTATRDFTLAQTAIQIDQVVVTATGETQRQRESGYSVTGVDSSSLNTTVNPTFAQALSAKAPGVNISQAGGVTGAAARVRIRGSNSVSLSNEPLIVVDGVRMNNNPMSTQLGVGGGTVSRLNDINPDDIENIEIVKGPAAATLYGTAASNGVIQITTKRGRAGQTRWNTFAEYGTLSDTYNYPANYKNVGTSVANGSKVIGCTIDQQARGICTSGTIATFNPLEFYDILGNPGWREQFGVNASGGREGATYYVGGDFEREQGLADPNNIKRANFRANVNATLSDALNVQVSTGFLSSRQGLPQNENNIFGYLSTGLLGNAFNCAPGPQRPAECTSSTGVVDSVSRGFFSRNPREFYFVDNTQAIEKYIAGVTVNWLPKRWIRGTATTGVDLVNRNDNNLIAANKSTYTVALAEGSRFAARAQEFNYTAIGSLASEYDILSGQSLRGTTTVGAQFQRNGLYLITAQGRKLLPGTGALGGVSAGKDVGETNQTIITVGSFAEQRIAWRDRMFLTAALRGDKNSAFGTNFDLVYYPSASLSWVLSEEEFFPKSNLLGQLRARVAYGKAGQNPSFRQAQTFFNPVAVTIAGADVPAAVVGGTGNADLKPEVSGEFEAGIDASLFGSRIGLEVTYYNKNTEDALINVPLAPSLGLTASRFNNLGTVNNHGVEVGVHGVLFDMRNARLELNLTYSNTRNELKDIGVDALGKTLPAIQFNGGVQRFTNAFPLGAYFQRTIMSVTDKNGDGVVSRVGCKPYGGVANPGGATTIDLASCEIVLSDSVQFLGAPMPTREFAVSPTLTLMKWIRLNALVDYRGGYKIFNQTREFRCANFATCREIQDPKAPLADQAKVIARLMGSSVGYIEDGSFVRLRELSATLSASNAIASRLKTRGLSVTLGAQNLATWSDYSGFDPEVQSGASALNTFTSFDFFAQAPLRRFTGRVNVTF
jgi:TonB-dependent starch-binding outer membrane protein SusC